MTIDMALRYKGARNYLHGSDFVNASDAILRTERDARIAEISFRTFARNQCHFSLDPPGVEDKVVALGAGRDDRGAEVSFWIVEGAEVVRERYPFDEDAIGANATIQGGSINLSRPLPFTLIEVIIAMTKVLAYSESPKVDGKWVFGQLKLSRPLPADYSSIHVSREALITNKFSTNSITVDDRPLGDIRFIVGSP